MSELLGGKEDVLSVPAMSTVMYEAIRLISDRLPKIRGNGREQPSKPLS